MYSGYINVNATFGRNIFYWLIPATDVNPATAPLVFWYQGGPGSAGEYGLTFEQGPIQIGGTVKSPILSRRTTGAWTRWANMVFLDQPAGVGFSYSTNTNDYALNSDTRAQTDNKRFLDIFFSLLPQYLKQPWWLSGESYGGVYVPSLADAVMSDATLSTSFAGIMIGYRCCGFLFVLPCSFFISYLTIVLTLPDLAIPSFVAPVAKSARASRSSRCFIGRAWCRTMI